MPKSELRKIFWFSALLGFKGCSREGVVALSHPLAMGTHIGYDCSEKGLEGAKPWDVWGRVGIEGSQHLLRF